MPIVGFVAYDAWMLGHAVILPVKSLNDKHPIGIAHAAGTLMI